MKRGSSLATLKEICKICPSSKRSQMELSFGMIFSIILIIIFLVFTGYVVFTFVGLGEKGQIAEFTTNLQKDVINARAGAIVSNVYEYKLPKKISLVCLIDFSSEKRGSSENKDLYEELDLSYFGEGEIVLHPTEFGEGLSSNTIKYLNLTKITEKENPYCIENKRGKTSITIKKDYGENLVTLTR